MKTITLTGMSSVGRLTEALTAMAFSEGMLPVNIHILVFETWQDEEGWSGTIYLKQKEKVT